MKDRVWSKEPVPLLIIGAVYQFRNRKIRMRLEGVVLQEAYVHPANRQKGVKPELEERAQFRLLVKNYDAYVHTRLIPLERIRARRELKLVRLP